MTAGLALTVALPALAAVSLIRRRRRRERVHRRVMVSEALAPTIDLIAVVIGAGGSIAEAVELVSERGPEPVRPVFTRVRAGQRRGVLLADALAAISDELGAEFHPLTTALVVSAQGGAPVGALLQRLADEANQARRRVIETRVRRLPVVLIVPLVVCQLPAVIVGSVVPLALLAVRSLQG